MLSNPHIRLFDKITMPLRDHGDLSSAGLTAAREDCERNGSLTALIPKLQALGVKAERLTATLAQVLNKPQWPYKELPLIIERLKKEKQDQGLPWEVPKPKVLETGQGWIRADNGTLYLVNPLDENMEASLTSRFEHEIRLIGVISEPKFLELIEHLHAENEEQRRQLDQNRGGEKSAGSTLLSRIMGGPRSEEPVSNPSQDELDRLIRDAARVNASDIHFDPAPKKVALKMRVDGDLRTLGEYEYDAYLGIANRIISQSGGKSGSYISPLDGMFVFELPGPRTIKLRVMMVPVILPNRQELMPKIVLRLLGNRLEQIALTDLGIPDIESNDQFTQIALLCERKNGLILVSGPTGSGKTTTLSAIQQQMLKYYPNREYYTAEDPVEGNIPGVNHVQINPESGLDFPRAVKSFLRGDPDVIMIGEIRDKEAASQALTASITGHLVLSTIHTNSSIETAIRLIDMGCDSFIVSSALKAATAQRLVKKLCVDCSIEASWNDLVNGTHEIFDKRENKLMKLRYKNAPRVYGDLDFYPSNCTVRLRGTGCKNCDNGIKGRALVSELFVLAPEVSEVIARKESFATVRRIAMENGFKDIWQHAMYLVRNGVISFDDAVLDIGERDMVAGVERKPAPPPGPHPLLSVVGQN